MIETKRYAVFRHYGTEGWQPTFFDSFPEASNDYVHGGHGEQKVLVEVMPLVVYQTKHDTEGRVQ